MKRIILFGGGGHGVSVLDILMSCTEYMVEAIADMKSSTPIYDIPVISDLEADAFEIKKAIVAIGDNQLRQKIAKDLYRRGYGLVNAISPLAYVSPRAKLGKGVVVMPYAVVNAGATIGDGTIINTKASVDHDTTVGEFCHIAPGSTLCGFVKVGDTSFVCAGATIIDRVSIGVNATIAAGAVVIRDVLSGDTVMGIPAKSKK